MEYDPSTIEAKWRERWSSDGWYEPDPTGDPDETTYVTAAYPYPNGAMHIGHVRTYTVPDVYARYRRLCGDQVLYPMAWHVTGTPIIGAVERLKNEEPEQMRILTDVYNVPEEDLDELETPMGFARYFIENSYKSAMKQLGLSIDWRREFTTNDDTYREFISWQYETLNDHGLLTEDTHPVNFCTNEKQPVTTHDILEGEDAEFQEYTLVKFNRGDEIVPMATLRPETVRGVTNAFVDPEATYVSATIDDEQWIISEAAAEKLSLQQRSVTVERTFSGEELVGEWVTNPVTDDDVIVLPASFVDADNATGVVMSVPAHSPDDWLALKAIKADVETLESYGIDPSVVTDIEPVSILELDDYGEYPAADAVDDAGITDPTDPALESVTQDLYTKEFHEGRLLDAYGEFAGEVIEDIRDEYRASLIDRGLFDAMYEFNETVICRCGGRVEVAEQDTWFIRYNDPSWRERTLEALDDVDIRPTTVRDQYEHTVNWLEEWPCIRNYGLGTPLPWDEEFIIEPLSDSTIYMAYYTIVHRLEDLGYDVDRSTFEALFGDGDVDDEIATLREEFEHWYPVDVRFSANELIANHLTFYLYHHAELFDATLWPEGITTMGLGFVKGETMSSSAGRVVLADTTIDEYGADTVRFYLLNSAEPWQDFDWRPDPVSDTRRQLERFWRNAIEIIEAPSGERDLRAIDRWLLGRLQRTIRQTTDAIENYETRSASQAAFYQLEDDLRWYRRRTDLSRPGARWVRQTVLETRLRLLNPFIPFMTNELHERLTGEPVEGQSWPTPDADLESDRREAGEALLKALVDDIQSIIDVTDSSPSTIRIYTAAGWKRAILDTILEADEPTTGRIMNKLMQHDRYRRRGDAVAETVQELIDLVHERPTETLETLATMDEARIIEEARGFLAREFDASVEVYSEDEDPIDPGDKAATALPARPAIHLA